MFPTSLLFNKFFKKNKKRVEEEDSNLIVQLTILRLGYMFEKLRL